MVQQWGHKNSLNPVIGFFNSGNPLTSKNPYEKKIYLRQGIDYAIYRSQIIKEWVVISN